MSSREERGGRFQGPEVGSSSGGHLAPDMAGPLFDPLDDPLPSERERREADSSRARSATGDTTEALPRASRPESRTSQPSAPHDLPARRQQVRKRGLRRVRRTVRRIDPFSVLKLSMFFYLIFLIVWLIFVAVIYSIVDSMGVFDAAEELGQALVLVEEVNITLAMVEKWALLIGIVFAVLGTLINTLLAILYNVGADLLGGLELTFVERDT